MESQVDIQSKMESQVDIRPRARYGLPPPPPRGSFVDHNFLKA